MESLEAQILTASQPLRVPGAGEQRVLSPVAVARLAVDWQCAGWQVEAAALDSGVTPLHYLRNLARFGAAGQARLLRATVAAVGVGPTMLQALEILASQGTGTFRVFQPVGREGATLAADGEMVQAVQAIHNRNVHCTVSSASLSLTSGNPAEALRGADLVIANLDDSMSEQLVQMACRMVSLPLVLGAVEESRGQATVVLPGDPGVALLYKPTHPHLEPRRGGMPPNLNATLAVGRWLADQAVRVLLGEPEVLARRLRYTDVNGGEVNEYPL